MEMCAKYGALNNWYVRECDVSHVNCKSEELGLWRKCITTIVQEPLGRYIPLTWL